MDPGPEMLWPGPNRAGKCPWKSPKKKSGFNGQIIEDSRIAHWNMVMLIDDRPWDELGNLCNHATVRKSILYLVLANLGNAYYLATIFMRLVRWTRAYAAYGSRSRKKRCFKTKNCQTCGWFLRFCAISSLLVRKAARVYLIDTVLNVKDSLDTFWIQFVVLRLSGRSLAPPGVQPGFRDGEEIVGREPNGQNCLLRKWVKMKQMKQMKQITSSTKPYWTISNLHITSPHLFVA